MKKDGGKPLLYLGTVWDLKEQLINIPALSHHAWTLLQKHNTPTRFFTFSGNPVFLKDVNEHKEILPFDVKTLRSTLDEMFDCMCLVKSEAVNAEENEGKSAKKYKHRRPPSALIEHMLNAHAILNYDLPRLQQIVTCPYFTKEGVLHDKPGYNAKTETYYHAVKALDVKVSEKPTDKAITVAKQWIFDHLLVDFPFAGQAERAHALCCMLQPYIRTMFDKVPLYVIEAPVPGTGKTLLADMMMFPFLGELAPKKQEQRKDSEWGKLITSILMTNPSVVLFDNIRYKLDNTALTVVLTTASWEDRILGSNNTVKVPNLATWIVTGNNPRLSDEIQRRSIRIRLEATTDRPNMRKNFRHKNIEQWAAEHRKELVWSCLTLIQHWIAKGKPTVSDGKELGSFERWSNVMEGILHVNGVKGFLENADDFYVVSSEIRNDLTELVCAWWKKIQACASTEKGYVNPWAEVSAGELYEGFVNAVDGEITLDLGRGNAQSQKIQLGLLLKENRGRVFTVPFNEKTDIQVQIQLAGKKKRSQVWTLVPIKEGKK